MNIAILSDTHGHLDIVKSFLKQVMKSDVIIHLGDYSSDGEYIRKYFNGRFIGVRGNCDFTSKCEEDIITTIDDKKFLITHGHKYNVKLSLLNLKLKASSEEVDVALFGHTHRSFHERVDGILFINPGSLCEPRYPDERTYCIINIYKNEINYEIKKIF